MSTWTDLIDSAGTAISDVIDATRGNNDPPVSMPPPTTTTGAGSQPATAPTPAVNNTGIYMGIGAAVLIGIVAIIILRR